MTRQWAHRRWEPDKIVSAICAFAVTGLIGYCLIAGLRGAPFLPTLTDDSPLALFNLRPPVEEKPEIVPPAKKPVSEHPGGAPSAPAPRPAEPREQVPRAAPIVAPAPIITLPVPSLPAVAPSGGLEEGAGVDGSGGGGGSGQGSGSGAGDSRGDGGGFSQARQTGGRFRNSDFPESARGAGRLKIGVRYVIGPSGHVDDCEIIERSGYAEVDAMTCRVIQERYRFRPARDPEGYAVAEVREEDYRWRVR